MRLLQSPSTIKTAVLCAHVEDRAFGSPLQLLQGHTVDPIAEAVVYEGSLAVAMYIAAW